MKGRPTNYETDFRESFEDLAGKKKIEGVSKGSGTSQHIFSFETLKTRAG